MHVCTDTLYVYQPCICNLSSFVSRTVQCTTKHCTTQLTHPQGEIYVNGIPMDEIRDWYVANTGYVLQLATPYYEELTVRENLTLAAQMKLPKTFTLKEKFERIEQVVEVVSDIQLLHGK